MSKSLVSILIMVFAYGWLHAQQPVFRHYSVDEGLPSSEVYQVIQDKKGYIWIATNMGVSRFDGRTFKNYDVQDGLPENTVFEVYEDETGRIWFISFPFQLSFFRNDSIIPYKYNSVLRMLAGRGAVPVKKSFMADKEDNVIFSLIGKPEINKISPVGDVSNLLNDTTNSNALTIIEYKNHLLTSQFSTKENFDKVNLRTDRIKGEYQIERSGKYSYAHTMAVKGRNDEIYCFQNEILTIIKNNKEVFQKKFNNRLIWIDKDKDGNLWLGTDKNGIIKIDPDNYDNKPQVFLKGLSVSSSFIDIEGGKWFSTLENGVYYSPSEGFISYSIEDGIKNKKITSLAIFRSSLYLGLNNKFLSIINIKNGESSYMSITGDSTGDIKALKATSNGLLWIGTDEYLYSYNGNKLVKFINNHKKILNNVAFTRNVFSIKDIEEYDNETLLLAEARGLTLIKNGNVIYNSFLDDQIELRIESIEKESDTSFLLGTISGLWRMTGLRFEFLGLQNPLFKHRANTVVSLGHKKGFIVGTKGSGLIVSMGDSIWQITKSDGLSSNSISSLLIINNDLWIGTNHGLNLIDIRKIKQKSPPILIYNKAHGLISNEINELEGSEDYIYIATNLGLTILDRKKHRLPNFHPPIYLNNVKIMKRDTAILDSYQLHHNQNFITISFIGISFRDGGNLLYKYRLKGLSNEWISTNNLEVEYAFLPPGSYQFEVIAINSEGNASIEPAVLSFKISHPYWQTWWFIALVILLALASVLAFYYYRLKIVKKEHALQNDINWYRQQALTRQMDPHFVFNTLNSIQSYIIKNDRLSSSQYLSKFARLMRLILNNSQKQAIPLSDEIAALNLYMELESLRFQQKFEFSIITDHSVDVDSCYIPAFLIQPFVENAIWHGIMGLKIQGIIRISFSRERDQLICQVEDNGIGRTQSMEMKPENEKQKKSLGISLVETRLNLLNYFYSVNMKIVFTDLFNEDNSPAGTKVTINLPIIN